MILLANNDWGFAKVVRRLGILECDFACAPVCLTALLNILNIDYG